MTWCSIKPAREGQTGEWAQRAGAANTRYVAILDDVERFSPTVWATAV